MANKHQNSVEDYQNIMAVLYNYVSGLHTGNVETLEKSFHTEAIMYGYWENFLVDGSINNLYESVTKHGQAPHITAHIDILYKAKDIALARIVYERNAAEKNGEDLHSLIRINGEWKIISKLFQIPAEDY